MNWLIFLLGLLIFFIRGFLGLLIGCLLSVNRMSELRDEIWRLRRKHENKKNY